MEVSLTVDGVSHTVAVEPRVSLADALRESCGITGVHLGCEQGACGACTVIVDSVAVRSCLIFAVQCDGSTVTTASGLSSTDRLHPVADALLRHAGLQCGYCTPGFVALIAAELQRDPHPDDERLLEIASSNVCRCTGYRGILAALRELADR